MKTAQLWLVAILSSENPMIENNFHFPRLKIAFNMMESIFSVCWLSTLQLVCSQENFEAHSFLPAQVISITF